MTNSILTLRDTLISMELSEETFWKMSLDEALRYADAYNERIKRKQKETISYIYSAGKLIGVGVASCLSSKVEYPTLQKAFPSLFDSPEGQKELQDEKTQKSINNLLSFASAFNAQFKGVENG